MLIKKQYLNATKTKAKLSEGQKRKDDMVMDWNNNSVNCNVPN